MFVKDVIISVVFFVDIDDDDDDDEWSIWPNVYLRYDF